MHVVAAIIVINLLLYLIRNMSPSGQVTIKHGLNFALGRGMVLVVVLIALGTGHPWVAGALCVVGLVPGHFAHYVLVPVGIPHLTYAFFRGVHLGFGKTEALFYELSARLRFGWALSPSALARLEQRLDAIMPTGYVEDTKIHGAAIASRAILDAAQGQRESARELFLVAQSLPRRICRPGSRSLSQGWLLADATARGDFTEVLRLCHEGPRTLQRAYFRTLARRRLGHSLGWADRLAALCAPFACRGPLAALRLAKLVSPIQQAGALQLPSPDAAVDFVAAKQALIGVATRPLGSVSRPELRRLGRIWQTLDESGALSEGMTKFAAASGQTQSAFFDVGSASRELLDEVVDVFERLWRHSLPEKAPADECCPLILQVEDRIEQGSMGELERLIARLPSAGSRDASVEDCWRAWARLRALSRNVIHFLPARAEFILAPLRAPIIDWAAWLFNDNECKVLGFSVFHWLLEHTPKSDGNYEVLKDNTRLARRAV